MISNMQPTPLPQAGHRSSADPALLPLGNSTVRWLSLSLVLLALGIATSSILGPVSSGLMRYRTSATTLNQLLGGDAATLFVVAPLTLPAAVLTARRHPVAP